MPPETQEQFPETKIAQNAEVTSAAQGYIYHRDTRMKATDDEVTSRDRLVEMMQKHKLTVYEDEAANIRVDITELVKVKVKKLHSETEPE